MESHDLRVFKQVAEMQSISQAAEKLGYVQPNVSQRIKSLEEELGVQLFSRNNRGVALTGEGRSLLEYTNQILFLMDEAKSKINPSKWRESLLIGAPQTISAVKIPQLLSSFLTKNKNMDVKVRTMDKQKLQEMLYYGELDGVFINGTYNNSQFVSVYSYYEKVMLISPQQTPFKKKQDQTLLVNSDPDCIYRKILLEFTNKTNDKSTNIIELDSLESILQAVHDGLGISVIPADVANSRKNIQTVQYKELSETIKIDFVIKQRQHQPQSLTKFIRFLQNL
ncbi:LysR family transcriptional regulator [Niallia sp. 01092]|uniref:LysR family transcriptional regulator n=1 Tax=unclassified Niallia TaxID=2837522 RepID=UPI003FD0921A